MIDLDNTVAKTLKPYDFPQHGVFTLDIVPYFNIIGWLPFVLMAEVAKAGITAKNSLQYILRRIDKLLLIVEIPSRRESAGLSASPRRAEAPDHQIWGFFKFSPLPGIEVSDSCLWDGFIEAWQGIATAGILERRCAIRWTVPTPIPICLAIARQEAPDARRTRLS